MVVEVTVRDEIGDRRREQHAMHCRSPYRIGTLRAVAVGAASLRG